MWLLQKTVYSQRPKKRSLMKRNPQSGLSGVALACRQMMRVAECMTTIILIEEWATELAYSSCGLCKAGNNGYSPRSLGSEF